MSVIAYVVLSIFRSIMEVQIFCDHHLTLGNAVYTKSMTLQFMSASLAQLAIMLVLTIVSVNGDVVWKHTFCDSEIFISSIYIKDVCV